MLQLFRPLNLLFILITQYFFRYFIEVPFFFEKFPLALNDLQFFFLSISTVLIAAAGYAINDYFDVKIDQINKPDRMTIDRRVSRRWAIFYHLLFNVVALIIAIYLANSLGSWKLLWPQFLAIVLLWFYSTKFKKTVFTGNFIVALLTGLVVIIVPFYDRYNSLADDGFIWTMALLYAFFAFFISFLRELVKDMEDIKGDAEEGCRTFPVVYGLKNSKGLYKWLNIGFVVLVAAMQLGQIAPQNWTIIAYALIFIQLPLLYSIYLIKRSDKQRDFHRLSNLIKGVMLAGILSMIVVAYTVSPEDFS